MVDDSANGSKYYHRYLASVRYQRHNVAMGLELFLLGFLQRVAVGAGVVLILFLLISLRLPRRSAILASRRTIR